MSQSDNPVTLPHTDSRTLLRYFLNLNSPFDIYDRLCDMVNNHMYFDDLDAMLEVFRHSNIIDYDIEVMATDTTLRHCVRCHSAFYGCENQLAACAIEHKSCLGPGQIVMGCCDGLSSPIDSEIHFIGSHTDSPQNVAYNGINIVTCGINGCMKDVEAANILADMKYHY